MNDSTNAVRAVRYRVLPGTQAKACRLNRIAGACRFVWNQVLADQEDLHRIAKMNGTILASGWARWNATSTTRPGASCASAGAHVAALPPLRPCGRGQQATQTTFRCQRPIAGPAPRIRSAPLRLRPKATPT